MNKLCEMMRIADIHVDRINMALEELAQRLPFDPVKVKSFTKQDLLLTELLVNRFGKLQDLIGKKIIDAFLEDKKEMIDGLAMIDKLNKLERLGIIDSVSTWQSMRDIRNHAAHEYPDHPELTAEYLNKTVELAPKLISILYNIKIKSNLHS